MEKLLADIVSGKQEAIHHDLSIQWDQTGFVLRNQKKPDGATRVSWSDVKKITAYKRDLFNVDLICLFFEQNDHTGVEVHEDTNHWPEFLEVLPIYLNGCKSEEEWISKVSVPTFAPNPSIIFEQRISQC